MLWRGESAFPVFFVVVFFLLTPDSHMHSGVTPLPVIKYVRDKRLNAHPSAWDVEEATQQQLPAWRRMSRSILQHRHASSAQIQPNVSHVSV